MAALCRILIAATLVGHLTMGCCWHHAHGSEGNDHSSLAHDQATHDDPCTGSGNDHSYPRPDDCEGVKCSFVSQGRPVSSLLVQPMQASLAVPIDDLASSAGFGTAQSSLASGRLLLPVRLHLANQVLLI